MISITLEIPEKIKNKFWIWESISYDNLIIKTIWKEFCSPDLEFNSYDNMDESHKIEFDKLDNIDKSKLLNI